MITKCGVSRRFRACGKPGVAVCHYCGRSFCDEHGDRLADNQEICHTKDCARKREDLEQHLAYKANVSERNATQRCGEERCGTQAQFECSKCRGRFCEDHLRERTVETGDGATMRGSVCTHCHKRRKLWSRR